ncbi:MAG: hypothetical protein ABFC94_18520, partial [Syntrophomonas sp.]
AKVDFELVTQNNEVEAKPVEGNEAPKNNGNGKSKDGFASRKKSKSNGKGNGKARRRSRRDGK